MQSNQTRVVALAGAMFVAALVGVPAAALAPASAAQDAAAKAELTWNDAGRAALDGALAKRAMHGLDHLVLLPNAPDGEQARARDARYTQAALAYAGALAHGRVDPATLHDVYTLARPDPDLRAALRKALADGRLSAWLSGLAPQDDEYARLSKAYLAFREQAAGAGPTKPIASREPIHVGDSDPRVKEIARQLVDDDYLPAMPGGSSPVAYSRSIADAVIALQKDFGIAADGIVGPDTLKVLNTGPDDRARALAVALERRRWLSRTPPATRIDVNTAAARLRYWRDGKLVDERRVIVGEPGRETPSLGSPIYRLVANPTWTIPKSIQNGDMANVDGAYLRAHNMVMQDGWIVQKSGPGNALGLVKFDMRNQHAIYLHDTSTRGLFDRSQRHLSHGCVRVDDALGFADMLAQQEGIADKWHAARESGEHRFVPLPREIPVRLIYGNVFVEGGERVVFRTDPYGWNDKVAQALGFQQTSSRRATVQAVDIGP